MALEPKLPMGAVTDDECAPDFSTVRHWIFDLDNTLYPAKCNLFAQIDARMTLFIERKLNLDHKQARTLQKHYYVEYGTTMSGLMSEHGVDPHDFMDFVHDIDLAALERCSELRNLIAELPGDKFVFTNGSAQHAANVCAKLGLDDLFNGVFDIVAADFKPKPHRVTYERFVETHNVDAAKAAMFEDIAHNLEAPYALGMKTVLIASDAVWIEDEPQHKRPASPEDDHSHVHHVTDDLKSFLKRLETAA